MPESFNRGVVIIQRHVKLKGRFVSDSRLRQRCVHGVGVGPDGVQPLSRGLRLLMSTVCLGIFRAVVAESESLLN